MAFQVRLDNFEGPLDLLLHLIKKNKMDICSIAISQVTDEYLSAIDEMKNLNLEIAGEFLVMAATLIHIKSRTLLPVMEDRDEEEDEGVDPGEDLVSRLKEYEFFKKAAETLGNCSLLGRDEFVNPVKLFEDFSDDDLEFCEVGLFDLMRVCRELWGERSEEPCHEVEIGFLSVSQRIEEICLLLTLSEIVEVRQLFPERPTQYQIIVTFLAILELVRLRRIRLKQKVQFGPIEVTSCIE
jgi:segregation and condensation protein A